MNDQMSRTASRKNQNGRFPETEPSWPSRESAAVQDLLWILRRKWLMLVLILLAGTVLAGLGRYWMQTPVYTSEATIFLTPQVSSSGIVDSDSLNSNKNLLNNAIALMTRENIMNPVSRSIGTLSAEQVERSLSIQGIENTELIRVSASTEDPELSTRIVQLTIQTFIEQMQENLNLKNISIVDQAKPVSAGVPVSLTRCLLSGLAVGAGADMVLILLYYFFDHKLHTRAKAEALLQIPVLAVFPVYQE